MRIAEITVKPYEHGFIVSGTVNGKMRRKKYETEAIAIGVKHDWEREIANLPKISNTLTRLSLEQVKEAESAFHRLDGNALTLTTAIDYALANFKHTNRSMEVKAGIALFLAEKKTANLRPRTIANLKNRLSLLGVMAGGLQVNQVNSELCRTLIFRDKSSTRNRINDSLAFTNFFSWAVKQGFAGLNPMERVQNITADEKEPEVLTLADVRRLLVAAKAHKGGILIPYVVLGTFCAIRPAELARLTWADIDLDAKSVTISAKIAKMRSRRTVTISDNAVAFLLPFVTKKTPIAGANWRKDFDAVKHAAGFNGKDTETTRAWIQDGMRHTGISYHLFYGQNEGATASWAGNSPDVIHKHYKGLVKSKDCAEFWDITPANLAGVIIDLKAHAA